MQDKTKSDGCRTLARDRDFGAVGKVCGLEFRLVEIHRSLGFRPSVVSIGFGVLSIP